MIHNASNDIQSLPLNGLWKFSYVAVPAEFLARYMPPNTMMSAMADILLYVSHLHSDHIDTQHI